MPVLTYSGLNAADYAREQVCPNCGEPDAVRYIGSRVATLLSVGRSNLFGMPQLAQEEKKTLVFADSVQDAAHRAGFVQSLSRAFEIRALLKTEVGGEDVAVAQMSLRILERADAAEDPPRALRAAAAGDRGSTHVHAVLVQGRGRERQARGRRGMVGTGNLESDHHAPTLPKRE